MKISHLCILSFSFTLTFNHKLLLFPSSFLFFNQEYLTFYSTFARCSLFWIPNWHLQVKGSNSIYLAPYNVYFGVDKKLKPPGDRTKAFTLAFPGEVTRYFTASGDDSDTFKWISQILLNKHPDGFDFPDFYEKEEDLAASTTTTPASSPSALQHHHHPRHGIDLGELKIKTQNRRHTTTPDDAADDVTSSPPLHRGTSMRSKSDTQKN